MKDSKKHLYAKLRNEEGEESPNQPGSSELSPYMEFELSNFGEIQDDSLNDNIRHAAGSRSWEAIDGGGGDPLVHDLIRQDKAKSSMSMAFMNMANSILGAGVVGQPSAIKNCGLIGGLVVTVLLTIIVDWTIRLIVVNLKLSGKTTYQDTVEMAMGRKGKLLILVVNGLFAFGGCIGFCIIVGDSIPYVLKAFLPAYSHYFRRNLIITLFTAFLSYPLSLNRDISKLSKASMLALVSIIVIVMIVVIKVPSVESEYKGNFTSSELLITPRVFQGISVISFALVCHHNSSFIFYSLKKPSLRVFGNLTHISCIISMIICLLAGYSGFLCFKDKTKGNILNNFPSQDIAINFARFLFGFNMLTTFPLELFVLRDVVRDLIYFNSIKGPDPIYLDTRKHFILTTVLVALVTSLSLTTCNLGALLELVGSTTASLIAYILPPWTNLVLTNKTKTFRDRAPHYACILFGFTVMIVSSFQTITAPLSGKAENQCG